MDYERWTEEEEDPLYFEFDGRGYRFEPEYTDEELRQMEMEARPPEAPEAPCACGQCRQMQTEEESSRCCCTEWDLVVTAGRASLNVSPPVCITENVRQLINKSVLETFFWAINWKKRPTPEGPNGQLSERQYRFVAYRVILEWALKGQPLPLGRGNHVGLPRCVVWAVRDAFPSPTGQYAGVEPSQIEDLF